MESVYYSPGVNLRQEGGYTYLDIVRCKIDDQCPVQFASEYQEDGSQKVTVRSDVDAAHIFVEGETEAKSLSDF